MKRRTALKYSGLGLGLSLGGASLISLISSCKEDVAAGKTVSLLSQKELEFVYSISDIILPTTNTPGALDVGAPDFIQHFVSKVYSPEGLSEFRQEIIKLDEECRSKYGKSLSGCSPVEKHEFVKSLESGDLIPSMNIWGNSVSDGSPKPFYKDLKSMVLWAYFSSEKVGKEVLLYQQLAPDYQGCVAVTAETRLPSI